MAMVTHSRTELAITHRFAVPLSPKGEGGVERRVRVSSIRYRAHEKED
jgi:hypothetical protein